MNSDPYADLSYLCGITAFSLPPPPLPLPAPRPSADRHTTDLFGPIPGHLLSRYLCYDDPSPEVHYFSSIPCSPSATTIYPSPHPLFLHSPSPGPNFTPHDSPLPPPDFTAPPSSESLLISHPYSPASGPRHMDSDSVDPEREILPPCVVNYQDSLCLTPEQESCSYSAALGVGDLGYENWVANSLPSEINEMPLCNPNDVLAEGNGTRLLSDIKKLALWHKDVILDEKECEKMVCFMISFSDFAFSRQGRRNSLQKPSRKKQRKHVAKSNGVASSFHFTRSKSANRLS